ncbi:hypothetical protein NDU88_005879 [Pleurodeles waltl]|uniref:Uncharacterized protein n=1 Tax=Pleurodeles waltl TaxID=8319 RepID=A0AAV7UN08_PLEWA|nr:hypothetical protein NDU88_005879 [Pleurodeles waltl]
MYSSINYVFVTISFFRVLHRAEISNNSISDDAHIELQWPRLAPFLVETPQWRLPPRLLQDPVDIAEIHKGIVYYYTHNTEWDVSLGVLWDGFKANLQGIISSMAIARSREARLVEEGLTSEIKALDQQDKVNPTRKHNRQLDILPGQLYAQKPNKAEWARSALKQHYCEIGNKGGLLLAYRLRQVRARSHIAKLGMPDGSWAITERDKRQEFRTYYQTVHEQDVVSHGLLPN